MDINIKQISDERFQGETEYLGTNMEVPRMNPLVSVIVATYQHVSFIRQCFESILMQNTTFPFEILVGDDESTDGTREICKEYAEKYPEKIPAFSKKEGNFSLSRSTNWWYLSVQCKMAEEKCKGKIHYSL